MTFALLVLALIAVNRARGDDRWKPSWLPGRALFYAAGAVGLVSLLVAPPLLAIAWALTYLVWGLPPWGRWYDLGRLPDDFGRHSPPNLFERWVAELAAGVDHTALFLRHFAIVPGLLLVASLVEAWWLPLIGIPFAVVVVLAYETGWRLWPKQPILLAELLTGAIWGALIGGVSYVV